MRKATKRILSALFAAVTIFSFAGCTKKNEAEVVKGPVTLKWIIPGPGVQQDSKKVWEEFNKKLKTYEGFENLTIDFEVVPTAEYAQKFMLMLTGKEKIDIAGTYTLDYASYARDDTFFDMTDYMDKCAPDMKDAMPDWALDLSRVDGRLYAFTNYQQMASVRQAWTFQKEDADKYLNFDGFQKKRL